MPETHAHPAPAAPRLKRRRSSVVRVQDAAEPYTVEIAITLRAAPEEGVQARCGCMRAVLCSVLRPLRTLCTYRCTHRAAADAPPAAAQDAPVYARGVGVFHKIGAVRSLNG